MSKTEKNQTQKTETPKTETPKHLTIANCFESVAIVGGTKKDLATKIIATLKANGQTQTKKKILMENAVPRQINAMLSEVGKKGRWAKFKLVVKKQDGKDDEIKLELTTTEK